MTQHRSINQRLKRARTAEAKTETALEWITDWQSEQERLIAELEKAVYRDNYPVVRRLLIEVKNHSSNHFAALPGVIRALIGD